MREHPMNEEMQQQFSHALQKENLFAGIRANELRLILTAARILKYSAGEFLYSMGNASESCFIMLSGSVRVINKHDRTGGWLDSMSLPSPRIIGAKDMLMQQPRSSSVITNEDVLTLSISEKTFKRLMTGVPTFSYRLSLSLSEQLMYQEKAAAVPRLKLKMLEEVNSDVLSLLPLHLIHDHKLIPLTIDGNSMKVAFVDDPQKDVINQLKEFLPGIQPYLYRLSQKNYEILLQRHGIEAPVEEEPPSKSSSPASPPVATSLPTTMATAPPTLPGTSPTTALSDSSADSSMLKELLQTLASQGATLQQLQIQANQSIQMQTQQFQNIQTAGGPIAPAPPPPLSSYADLRAMRPKRPKLTPEQKKAKLSEILPLLHMMIREGASDLHLSAGQAIRWRIDGDLHEVPGGKVLGEEEVWELLAGMMEERHLRAFDKEEQADFSYSIEGLARYRANIYTEVNGYSAVLRQIPLHIPNVKELNLPSSVRSMTELRQGLVLVTGPTGSGKSTTLAALINQLNEWHPKHIITLEDPIEFVHSSQKSMINQREIGLHATSFSHALRAALREDPDIVMVGELRDRETMSLAIETAFTGHLVFGTLHTNNVISTVDRIIEMFPPEQHNQVRNSLGEVLKGVVCQVLCKRVSKGRVAAFEVMSVNSALSNVIRQGKSHQIPTSMTGKGNVLLNANLFDLYKKKIITEQEAMFRAVDKTDMQMRFDNQNPMQGQGQNKQSIQTFGARKS